MSLPQLLLVDDSEAVLAFGRAALSGHYQISCAQSGREALATLSRLRPAAVLLDLSMPEMDGDEVLARMKETPALAGIPVVILSSEKGRAPACLTAGAAAFVSKPARASELIAAIGQAIANAERAARAGSLAVLLLEVGPQTLALPLDCVVTVLAQPLTERAPVGPDELRETFLLWGQRVRVFDLATRLGVEHARKIEERQLVVLGRGALLLALGADRVHDPEELPPSLLLPQPDADAAGPLAGLLRATARSSRGAVPVLEPRALLDRAASASAAPEDLAHRDVELGTGEPQ